MALGARTSGDAEEDPYYSSGGDSTGSGAGTTAEDIVNETMNATADDVTAE